MKKRLLSQSFVLFMAEEISAINYLKRNIEKIHKLTAFVSKWQVLFLCLFYEMTNYMKIFSDLFHSRDKPKNSTAGSSYRFFTGGSTAGNNVTERSAMQMTAVYSCVRVLSDWVVKVTLKNTGKSRTISENSGSDTYFNVNDANYGLAGCT